MKIGSINVRGLRDRTKRHAVFRYVKQNQFDLMLLQETYIVTEDVKKWKNEWGAEFHAAPHSRHSRGLIILFRKGLEIKEI